MTQDTDTGAGALPQAVVAAKSGFSIVWLVPVVAALIGAWLVYKAVTETGPTITIDFATGAGLVAGKTKNEGQGCRSRPRDRRRTSQGPGRGQGHC